MALDRRSLVRRHNPRLTGFDPYGPLTIGNGEFAFTADATGLQTFDDLSQGGQPLCTQSQWGWHTAPRAGGGTWSRSDLRLETFDADGRAVGYATSSAGQEEAFRWLRENPHRLHLGRLAFDFGSVPVREDFDQIDQMLDLWTGTVTSRFLYRGASAEVRSVCHPDRDLLSFSVTSALLPDRLSVLLSFPYGSPTLVAADWEGAARHSSRLEGRGGGVLISRRLDDDAYLVWLDLSEGARCEQTGPHDFRISAAGTELRFSVEFLRPEQTPETHPVWEACAEASSRSWEGFWSRGGAVELAGSRDPRALELERRVVLSQYLTAVQCAGSLPPQETGLSGNSWYGKFHLEMHWWHAAHFPLWGRPELLERSAGWYFDRLESAEARAASQGYRGARWPKMVGPDGGDSPSAIGPLLIWQQPHLIHLAELLARARPDRPLPAFWDELIGRTADFMASFLTRSGSLGPPVIPAQENHDPRVTADPAFEVAYWDYGLRQADAWFRRRGKTPDPGWLQAAARLGGLAVSGGLYQAHRGCPDTFAGFQTDHPSMLGALGVLPGDKVDRAVMADTLERVWKDWNWDEVWGWDFPLTAMSAARLGRPGLAVEALLHPSPKNTFSVNGHNRQGSVRELPLYLPGNGGLLAAVALMAAGWDGALASDAPGFPRDGSWTVGHEGLIRFP